MEASRHAKKWSLIPNAVRPLWSEKDLAREGVDNFRGLRKRTHIH